MYIIMVVVEVYNIIGRKKTKGEKQKFSDQNPGNYCLFGNTKEMEQGQLFLSFGPVAACHSQQATRSTNIKIIRSESTICYINKSKLKEKGRENNSYMKKKQFTYTNNRA